MGLSTETKIEEIAAIKKRLLEVAITYQNATQTPEPKIIGRRPELFPEKKLVRTSWGVVFFQ